MHFLVPDNNFFLLLFCKSEHQFAEEILENGTMVYKPAISLLLLD
jgi:hypothetical protein